MAVVRTLVGDIEAASLGITYVHEHTLAQPPRSFGGWEPDLVLDDIDATVRELEAFRAVGGTCLVDASTIDYGRDASATAEAARRSGCHVIATSGFNKQAYFGPEIDSAAAEALEERVARDVTVGIDGTAHRAGALKFGTSYHHMTTVEERAARAVCRVQRRTGLPLYTHTEVGTFALEQVELIRSEGVEPGRVAIGHLDRNPDSWYIERVAGKGVYIGIDQIGKVRYATDQVRIELIIGLVRAGYGRRILISGDMARRSYLGAYGGGPGLPYIAASFVPRLAIELRERGFATAAAERITEDLLINNPREFLAVQA